MSEEILVSVICTAYNHEKYIRSALDGFVMQKTSFPFEVLINDDASTDGTAAIIREYAEKYPDIIVPVYQTENQYSKNVSIISNILLPMARGKYIAFCEGDDYWTDENKLQMQIDFLESHSDYIACVHNTTFKDCSGKSRDKLVVERNDEHDVIFEDVIFGMKNAYQTSSLTVRREVFSNLPDFCHIADKHGFGDYPNAIWFTIISKIRFLPYNMSTYRFMSTSQSWSASTYTRTNLIKHNKVLIEILQAVKSHVSAERCNLLDKVILEQEYNNVELDRRFSELKRPEFQEIWKNKPLLYKIKIYVKQHFPWLYKILGNVKE